MLGCLRQSPHACDGWVGEMVSDRLPCLPAWHAACNVHVTVREGPMLAYWSKIGVRSDGEVREGWPSVQAEIDTQQ